jgi:hypothetical protein
MGLLQMLWKRVEILGSNLTTHTLAIKFLALTLFHVTWARSSSKSLMTLTTIIKLNRKSHWSG